MRRLLLTSFATLLMFGFMAAPDASAQQSVNISLGAFVPRTFDARDARDPIAHAEPAEVVLDPRRR